MDKTIRRALMKPNVPKMQQDPTPRSAESTKWDHTAVFDLDDTSGSLRELREFWRQQQAQQKQESSDDDSQ